MTENQPSEQSSSAYPPIEYVFVERKRKSFLRRPGCILALIIWFIVMLTPFFLFVLAAQQEITISHFGDVPDSFQHPFLQVQLVMERDYRGLRLVNTTLHRQDDKNLCIQTNVRYVLWQGEGEPATFCRCYNRENIGAEWRLQEQILQACK